MKITYKGGVIDCLGCGKVVPIKSLSDECLCESCQYEHEAKQDAKDDE